MSRRTGNGKPESGRADAEEGPRIFWGPVVKVDRLMRETIRKGEEKDHSPEFKTKVALEAIRGALTELSRKYGEHPNMISGWKRAADRKMDP